MKMIKHILILSQIIKLFLKKSNKSDLKGKTTTDYFDYAILISNSQANKPIEELDK